MAVQRTSSSYYAIATCLSDRIEHVENPYTRRVQNDKKCNYKERITTSENAEKIQKKNDALSSFNRKQMYFK